MFTLSQVDLSLIQASIGSEKIIKVVTANGTFAILASIRRIIRWQKNNRNFQYFDLPHASAKVFQLYVDPYGDIIISLINGENWYWQSKSLKPFIITRWRGIAMSAISFDMYHRVENLTDRILIGTVCGCVYETELDAKRKEPFLKLLLKSEWISMISGLHIMKTRNVAESQICVLIAAEAPNISIHKFSGGTTLDAVFVPQNSPHLLFADATSIVNSELCSSAQIHHGDDGCSIGVKTEHGIFHTNFALSAVKSTSDYTLSNEGIADYPRKEALLSFLMRGPHFILMYHDAIVLINKFNNRIVEETSIKGEAFQGLCGGGSLGATWLYTEYSIYQICLASEDEILWKVHLENGLDGDEHEYEDALRHCQSTRARALAHHVYARHLINLRNISAAAVSLKMQNHASFESVSLELLEHAKMNVLSAYLRETLNKCVERDKAQQVIICTWLVELYLSKLTSAYDINLNHMYSAFRLFLCQSRDVLHMKTTFQLIKSHGCDEAAAPLAEEMKVDELLVAHFMHEHSWSFVLSTLLFASFEEAEELIYETSLALFEKQPVRTAQTLACKTRLRTAKLLPGLIRSFDEMNFEASKWQLRFSKEVMKYAQLDTAVQNYFTALYVKLDDDTDLLRKYLDTSSNLFCLQLALRTCFSGLHSCTCAWIYMSLRLYEDAVDLALHFDLNLAKDYASLPEIPLRIKKRLWLRVAKHIIDDRSLTISEAAQILEESPLLSIENILPFFPDFIVIDTFKADICASLEEYNHNLVSLRTEMNEYTTTSNDIHSKINKINETFYMLSANTQCAFSGYPILNRPFHYFSSGFVYCSNVLSDCAVAHCKFNELKPQPDITCPLTGHLMINSVDAPFFVEFEAATWDV